jgi:hypothetical protein
MCLVSYTIDVGCPWCRTILILYLGPGIGTRGSDPHAQHRTAGTDCDFVIAYVQETSQLHIRQ